MTSETDYPRQRTVAELLAEHGGGAPTGRRRRRRAADEADPVGGSTAEPSAHVSPPAPDVESPAWMDAPSEPDRSVLREPVPDDPTIGVASMWDQPERDRPDWGQPGRDQPRADLPPAAPIDPQATYRFPDRPAAPPPAVRPRLDSPTEHIPLISQAALRDFGHTGPVERLRRASPRWQDALDIVRADAAGRAPVADWPAEDDGGPPTQAGAPPDFEELDEQYRADSHPARPAWSERPQAGPAPAGHGRNGRGPAGRDLAGLAPAGRDLAGRDLAGRDLAGSDLAGSDLTGRESAGQELNGHGPAGHGPAGHGPAGHGPAGHGPAGHGPAGHGPAGHGPAGHGPAGRIPAAPVLAGQEPALPDFAGHDPAADPDADERTRQVAAAEPEEDAPRPRRRLGRSAATGGEDDPRPRRRLGRSTASTPVGPAWAMVLAQWILGALGGATLWVGFRILWRSLPVVALAAAVLATIGMVVLVRALLHSNDRRTTVLAVLVGLLLTASPALLVLLDR